MTADNPPNGSSAASQNTSPMGPSVHDATSLDDVRASLAALHTRESAITYRLDGILASQFEVSRELGRLDLLRTNLDSQVIATRSINNGILFSAADSAGRLSNRIKELDLEKDHVQQTLRVVEQVSELKACVHGVVGSMGAPQDWEAAAGYIARASKVPESIIQGGFAASIVPSVEVPNAPWVTLENAKESLWRLFLREFEKAAKEGEGSQVTRFFKLFPLIGRGDVGLDVYGRYVCQGVAGTARQTLKEVPGEKGREDGFFYANALTKLFEHIAVIVDGHRGLVERYYGEGKMVRVIERLQVEADVQGGIILDLWSDERRVDRKLTDIKSYPFSFIVQSFLHAQKGLTGTPRMNSPALGGGTNARVSEDEGVDMKEVDGLLSEIAVMLGKWSMFSRFLAMQCKSPDTAADAKLLVPEVLTNSNLTKKVSTKLITPYKDMSAFFFRRSVEKAFQLDELPAGLSLNMNKVLESNPPFIISAVDDVMYIVSAILQKSMSTSQKDVVISVILTVGRVLGSDFIGMVERKMRDESQPRGVTHGGYLPEDKTINLIVLINSLDVANEYLSRIISAYLGTSEQGTGTASSNPLAGSFPFENDATFIASALTNLNLSLSAKTNELLSGKLKVLFNQVVKPRLQPILTDTFRDTDYALTEDELAEITRQNEDNEEEMLDRVQRKFEHAWNLFMKPVERLMTPKTFSILMDNTARELSRVLERRVWSYGRRTSAYGAIRMERDFSGIVSVVTKGNYRVRELFTRVLQILMVANMEDDEWEELSAEGEDGMQWVLTEEERQKARNLVSE